MAVRRTAEERLQELELRKKQIEARMKEISKKESEKERRERTRRLIQNGALAETYLNSDGVNHDVFKALLEKIVDIPEVKNLIGNKANE